ncbi:MAG TPA: DUF5684 domain-containing protein [Bacillota bacterium]|nr:DUF5684 domain-containing protein [Bacillota bacterium]
MTNHYYNYDYQYSDMYDWSDISGFFAAILPFLAVLAIIFTILSLFSALCMWKIFKKAGRPGWAAIIPFYNAYILYEIVWGSGWMFLLAFLPVVNTAITIMTICRLSDVFGKGAGFALGIFLFPIVFLAILAFDDSIYIGIRDPRRCAGCPAYIQRTYPQNPQYSSYQQYQAYSQNAPAAPVPPAEPLSQAPPAEQAEPSPEEV